MKVKVPYSVADVAFFTDRHDNIRLRISLFHTRIHRKPDWVVQFEGNGTSPDILPGTIELEDSCNEKSQSWWFDKLQMGEWVYVRFLIENNAIKNYEVQFEY